MKRLFLLLLFPLLLFAQQQNFPSGGGGLTQVAALPTTACTANAQVQLTVAPFRTYTCIGNTPTTNFPLWNSADGTKNVYAQDYGVDPNSVVMFCQAVTNGTAAVSVGANDPPILASYVGWGIEATDQACAGNGGQIVNNMAFSAANAKVLTYGSVNSFTANVAAGGSYGNGTTCCTMILFRDDSGPALQNAFNATLAKCGQVLILPEGGFAIGNYISHSNPQVCGAVGGFDINQAGYAVSGGGISGTEIYPLDTLSCAGLPDAMFFGALNASQAIELSGFTINGAGNFSHYNANCNGKYMLRIGNAGKVRDVQIYNYATASNAPTGLGVTSSSAIALVENFIDYNGGNFCTIALAPVTFSNVLCLTSGNSQFQLGGSVPTINSYGSTWGSAYTQDLSVLGAGTLNLYGDNITPFNAIPGITCGAVGNTNINLFGVQYYGSLTTNALVLNAGGNPCVVHARDTKFWYTNVLVTGTVAGSQFYDEGGNSYNGSIASILPTCTFTSGGGSSPSCVLQANSTNEKGVIIASTGTGSPGTTGTITLTFFQAFTGATASSPTCTFNIDNSGTAWANEAVVQVNTQSSTAPVLAWANDGSGVLGALATSSPYRIDYNCTAR